MSVRISIFSCSRFACLLVGLILLSLFRLVLENEGTELQTEINIGALPTRFAIEFDVAIVDTNISLGIFAFFTQNKLGDEIVQVILKFSGLMCTVDDPAVIGWVCIRLCSEFEPKVLDYICK